MQNSNPTTNSNDNSQNQNSTMPSNNIDELLRVGSNAIDPMSQVPAQAQVVNEAPTMPIVEAPVVNTITEPMVIVPENTPAPINEVPALNVEVVPDVTLRDMPDIQEAPLNIPIVEQSQPADPNQLAQSVVVEAPQVEVTPVESSQIEVAQAPIDVPQANVEVEAVKPIENVVIPVVAEPSIVENPIADSTFTPGPALNAPMVGMQENTVNVENLNVTDIMDTAAVSAPVVESMPELVAVQENIIPPVEAARQIPTEINPQLNSIFDSVPSEVNITPTTNIEMPVNIPAGNNIESVGNSDATISSIPNNSLPSIETIKQVVVHTPKSKGGFSIARFILWTVILLLGVLSLVIGFYFARLINIPFLDTLFKF